MLAIQGPRRFFEIFIKHVLKLLDNFQCPDDFCSSIQVIFSSIKVVILLINSHPFTKRVLPRK